MMRRIVLVTAIWVIAGSSTTIGAPETSLPGGTLFTLNVPMKFQAIHPSITHVTMRCELRGYAYATGLKPGVATVVFATKGAAPNLITFPLVQWSPDLPLPPGFTDMDAGVGGYYTGTHTLFFSSNDFGLNPTGLTDPRGVTEGRCYFGLRGGDGMVYEPLHDPALISQEVWYIRQSLTNSGSVPITQPPATAWPPLLQPTAAKTDPLRSPYRWVAVWLLPFPKY